MKLRRSKEDWLDQGLAMLAQSGIGAIKAERIASSFNASRGSFYWHFRDIEDFRVSLLRRWQEVRTHDIIAEIEENGRGSERLKLVMRKIMCGDKSLERAVRAWAASDQRAAAAVTAVDKTRIRYLAEILRSTGLAAQQVQARASFIYWGYIGRSMLGTRASKLRTLQLDSIAETLLEGQETSRQEKLSCGSSPRKS